MYIEIERILIDVSLKNNRYEILERGVLGMEYLTARRDTEPSAYCTKCFDTGPCLFNLHMTRHPDYLLSPRLSTPYHPSSDIADLIQSSDSSLVSEYTTGTVRFAII